MGILEILGNYLVKPAATPEMLGELLNSTTYIPKQIYNTVTGNSDLPSLMNSAEAATIPRQQRDEEELLGNIKTPQSIQAQTQPRQQQDDSPYLGMINSMFNQKPTSKWDDIFNTITKRTQQVSGILNTIGGDNNALNNVVQNQKPVNPLDMERLKEQIRHNKEIETIAGTKANKGGGEDLKTLTTSAVEKLSDSDRAINELANLSDKLNKNSDVVGVVSGLRKYNPFDVQARSLQADVDRVRQLVGRALEGGVLRKEDEEKYKKILTEITDDPRVAKYKIKEITRDMEANRENNLSNFERAGYKTSGFRSNKTISKTAQTSATKRRRYNPETGNFEEI